MPTTSCNVPLSFRPTIAVSPQELAALAVPVVSPVPSLIELQARGLRYRLDKLEMPIPPSKSAGRFSHLSSTPPPPTALRAVDLLNHALWEIDLVFDEEAEEKKNKARQ